MSRKPVKPNTAMAFASTAKHVQHNIEINNKKVHMCPFQGFEQKATQYLLILIYYIKHEQSVKKESIVDALNIVR